VATLLREADIPSIFQWSEALFAGKTIAADVKARIFRYSPDPDRPATIETGRASVTIPSALAKEVIQRDGYFCRFCGIPVIDPKAASFFRKAYAGALRWGPRNPDKHTAFQALDLDLDHITPRSLGGQNSLDNLIVTCAPCNCGKANHTLREMGLNDPRNRTPLVPSGFETWDGLTLVLRKPNSHNISL
jgi:5-methylcytosine-specific restriction endonuclease McrA